MPEPSHHRPPSVTKLVTNSENSPMVVFTKRIIELMKKDSTYEGIKAKINLESADNNQIFEKILDLLAVSNIDVTLTSTPAEVAFVLPQLIQNAIGDDVFKKIKESLTRRINEIRTPQEQNLALVPSSHLASVTHAILNTFNSDTHPLYNKETGKKLINAINNYFSENFPNPALNPNLSENGHIPYKITQETGKLCRDLVGDLYVHELMVRSKDEN